MAKERKEGRRGQSARAARKRYRDPEELARAREQGQRLHAASLAWRAANPEAVREAQARSTAAFHANRAEKGLEKMVILHVLVRPEQLLYLQARARACPCPLAELLRGILDQVIYSVEES